MAATRTPSERSRRRRIRVLAPFVAAVLALTWASAPVSATIVERNSFTQPYEFVNWDCGYPMQIAGVESHKVQIRANKALAGSVFVHGQLRLQGDVDHAGRPVVRARRKRLGEGCQGQVDRRIPLRVHVPQIGAGPDVTDSAGRSSRATAGTSRSTTRSTSPTSTFNFLGFRSRGPHPVFETDLCKLVAGLVGTDSARYLTPRPLGSTASPMGYEEYLPPSYHASGAKSPLLVFFNGYGESGDGSAEA